MSSPLYDPIPRDWVKGLYYTESTFAACAKAVNTIIEE
jgi:hypothetical protein